MAAIDMVACGLVEVSSESFLMLKREVRKEMRTMRIQLKYTGSEMFRMESRGKKGGHRVRAFLGRGTLIECCKIVVKNRTPSDHESV